MGEATNFCEQCGHPLGPGAQFCGGCGRRVVPAFAPPPEAEPAALVRRPGRLPWIIVGVVVVVLGAVAGRYFWGNSGGGPAAGPVMTAPVPAEPTTEAPPRQGAENTAVPRAPEAGGSRATGFAALPPPPPIDQQSEFPPLPPPPSLDQGEEATLPPNSSHDFPPDTGEGPRWPWTSQRLVTMGDLGQLSAWDLVVMRNEIYARHGWVFQRADLRDYFGQQPWYRPRGTPANRETANRLVQGRLTPLERRNIKTILQYEKELGGGL